MPFSITPVPFERFPEGAWIVALHRLLKFQSGSSLRLSLLPYGQSDLRL
jgi:hypothetical protein